MLFQELSDKNRYDGIWECLYYSKDLSVISMNHALYSQMTEKNWTRVKEQLTEDLKITMQKWVVYNEGDI